MIRSRFGKDSESTRDDSNQNLAEKIEKKNSAKFCFLSKVREALLQAKSVFAANMEDAKELEDMTRDEMAAKITLTWLPRSGLGEFRGNLGL
jgi:hypothetical protein